MRAEYSFLVSPHQDADPVTARWDRVFTALAAPPRRNRIRALNSTAGRYLPLPEAACPAPASVGDRRFRLRLRHQHLPMPSEVGYIRWREDPFRVERGPAFDEIASVVEAIVGSVGRYPETLVAGSEFPHSRA